MEKFWKLTLHANRNGLATPAQPMTTMMSKYPTTDFSGMNDKATIIKNSRKAMNNTERPNTSLEVTLG
jgi:hypothetical protein